ncbi:hypothetical protein [Henriciella sp.]|uniref:head-tail connector protein n=1 Tax=Henriciella sp. TaxID=1968823 RepID=UPI002626294F|nr:hypothetical protein [Henriciella sp.]
MTLTVISPPGEEALPLAEVKAFLRIGHDGEDGLVTKLAAGAEARLEEASGLALVTRTLRRSWTAWPSALWRRGIALRPGPVGTLLAVRILEADGIEMDVTGRFALTEGRLHLKAAQVCPLVSIGGRIEVDFETGFGDADDIPGDLLQALKALLLAAYARDGGTAMPEAAQAVIAARREVRL